MNEKDPFVAVAVAEQSSASEEHEPQHPTIASTSCSDNYTPTKVAVDCLGNDDQRLPAWAAVRRMWRRIRKHIDIVTESWRA